MNHRYVLKIAFTAVIRPQAKKTKKQGHKRAKETKKENRIFPENRLEKQIIFCRSGEDFSRQPRKHGYI